MRRLPYLRELADAEIEHMIAYLESTAANIGTSEAARAENARVLERCRLEQRCRRIERLRDDVE